MNESQWDDARKSRNKHTKWIFLIVLCVLTVLVIIICNNEDQLSDNSVISANTESEDSSIFFFNPDDSLEIEKRSNSGSAVNPEDKVNLPYNETKKIIRETQNDTLHKSKVKSEENSVGIKDSADKKTESAKVKEKAVSGMEKKIVLQYEKKSSRTINNSEQEYSVKLPAIRYKVIDRKDIIISLALELFYKDSVFERELLLRRGVLNAVALNLLQHKELASFNKEAAAREIEKKMNELFEQKALSRVIIREFNIEKVTE